MIRKARLSRVLVWAAGLALGALCGCGATSPVARNGNSKVWPAATTASAARGSGASDNPGIDFRCVAERIRNARAPFHWSYKKIVPPLTNADWEADITQDSIAGAVIDSSGTHAIHGARSDSTSWNTAVTILTRPLPASTFALVNNSSATMRTGMENANGENTIKYTIDTTQATGGEAGLIKNVLGARGFIKGAAWVTLQGCPVKFILNVEQPNEDGTVQKEHYEANVTKQ